MVTTPSFGQLLTEELANGYRVLVIDFAECEFMGSSGLAVLVAAREQAATAHTQLALAALTRAINRSLHATALDALFETFPSTDAALSPSASTEEEANPFPARRDDPPDKI